MLVPTLTLYAAVLVIFSALLHAGWNILGKSNTGSGYSFTLGASIAPLILLFPYLVWCISVLGFNSLDGYFWLLVTLSGIGQAIYLIGLIKAYDMGDIGVIYPIARALPVLMVGIGTVFIGQSLSINAWIGFVVLTLGCLLIPMRHFKDLRLGSYLNLGVLWSCIAAIGTTIYSIIDKQALTWLQLETSGLTKVQLAVFYLGVQFAAIALILIAWLLATNKRNELALTW